MNNMNRIRLKEKLLIKDGLVDITDPCYDNDVWCRINKVKVKKGNYVCWYEMVNIDGFGDRVVKMGITHENNIGTTPNFSKGSFIGVDAGLAGIYVYPKPNFNDEQWRNFIKELGDDYPTVHLNESGFTTSSGIGDGTYEVYFHKEENGDVFSIEIVFLREKLRTVGVKGIYVNLDDLYDFLESSEFGGEDISNELQNLLTGNEEDFE